MNTKIDTKLEEAVNELKAASLAQGKADQDTASIATRRQWSLAGLDKISGADLFDFEKIHELFSRDESAKLYKDEYSDNENGRMSRIMVAKVQSDLLSGFERDFRSRHRTAVRSRIHNAAIKLVGGDDKGTINSIKRYIGLILAEADGEILESDGTLPEPEK